jgi:hypothetical protein
VHATDWKSVLIAADVQLDRVISGNNQFAAFGYVYAPVDFTQDSGSVPVSFYGISGVVFTSPDGEHWTKGNSLTEDLFLDVAYGNGIYVACGSVGRVWTYTSVDGRVWTPRHNVPGNAYQVEWGNGRFFCGGRLRTIHVHQRLGLGAHDDPGVWFQRGHIWERSFHWAQQHQRRVQSFATISTSPDAANWNTHLLTNFPYVLKLAAGNGAYVALPRNSISDEQKGFVATSSDLQTWTVIDTDAGQELESVGYGDGQFVVVG